MISKDQFFVNPGIFAVHTLDKPIGSQFYQVPVTFFILCEQDLVVPGVFLFFGKCLLMAIGGYVEFTSNNGLYFKIALFVLMLVGFGNELEYTKHISMITDGQRGHSITDRFFI